MTKTRIFGLTSVIAGIILQFTYENDGKDFISGFLIGGGLALFLSGLHVKTKKK